MLCCEWPIDCITDSEENGSYEPDVDTNEEIHEEEDEEDIEVDRSPVVD